MSHASLSLLKRKRKRNSKEKKYKIKENRKRKMLVSKAFHNIYYLISISNLLSNSSNNSFAFFKSFLLSYISFSAVKSFYLTKYLFTSQTFLFFNIFSTSYSSTPFTSTGFGFLTLYLLTSFLYLSILLTFTTG